MFIVIAMLFSVFATLIMVPTMILILKPRFIFSSKKKSIPVAQTVVTSLLLGTALTMSMPKTSHADEVQDIVNRSDDASKFLSSTASAKFILTSKNGEQRVRLTKNMTKLAGNTQNNMRLTEFISPADVQGTTTLLIENAKGSDSMFVYLPALKKYAVLHQRIRVMLLLVRTLVMVMSLAISSVTGSTRNLQMANLMAKIAT